MFKIMGEYMSKTEELDESEKRKHAEELAREYRIAFGESWRIWIDTEENEDD